MSDVQSGWFRFLMDAELAKSYKMAGMIGSHGMGVTPNPLLESLLPSLLYIRLGAFLEDTFGDVIDARGLPGKKDRFADRIEVLNSHQLLKDTAAVHLVRKRRNELAHEPGQSCDWDELENAIRIAHAELESLGLVGARPQYEFVGERKMGTPDPDYSMAQDFCYGLKQNDEWVLKCSWKVNFGDKKES
jgi:hypothetical protein